MVNSEREKVWQERVVQWRAIGLSQRAFAIEHGIPIRQVGYWVRRLARGTQAVSALLPVRVVKAFPREKEKALEKSLQRLVADGVLQRVARGTYVNLLARYKRGNVIEDIAAVLRRGHYSYLSMESMLAEYGVISQVPLSRITLMTTGSGGEYDTPYGTIEFTHTKRRTANLIRRTVSAKDRPLRMATKQAAISDLVRSGRNVNMMEL